MAKTNNDRLEPQTDVEEEILKMTNVAHDIRVVIENILNTEDLDKRVETHIMHSFKEELEGIVANIAVFPTVDRRKTYTLKVDRKITECHEEEQNSSFREREVLEIHTEVQEENNFLVRKLEEAEEYIKRMETENTQMFERMEAMTEEMALAKGEGKWMTSGESCVQDGDNVLGQLEVENEELRAELEESKGFILQNNQQFVRELQRYNEKVWRLERQLEESESAVEECEERMDEYELLITKLREENFNLEVNARTMKLVTSKRVLTQKAINTRQQEGSRVVTQSSRLKNFFRNEIELSVLQKHPY